MPLYDFRCRQCGLEFEVSRPISRATEPGLCPLGASAEVDQVTASYNEMRFGRRLLDQTGVSALTDIWRELRRRLLLKLIRWKDV